MNIGVWIWSEEADKYGSKLASINLVQGELGFLKFWWWRGSVVVSMGDGGITCMLLQQHHMEGFPILKKTLYGNRGNNNNKKYKVENDGICVKKSHKDEVEECELETLNADDGDEDTFLLIQYPLSLSLFLLIIVVT